MQDGGIKRLLLGVLPGGGYVLELEHCYHTREEEAHLSLCFCPMRGRRGASVLCQEFRKAKWQGALSYCCPSEVPMCLIAVATPLTSFDFQYKLVIEFPPLPSPF